MCKVLIAEDEPFMVDITKQLLGDESSRWGSACKMDFTVCDTLAEAIALAPMHCAVIFDLALRDCSTEQGVEGIATLSKLAPVIVATGSADMTRRREAIRAGADDFLSKDEITHQPHQVVERILNAIIKREEHKR